MIEPIGHVESPLTDPAVAPKQGDEGAPEATLAFDARVADGLDGIATGDELILLTWLDRADRSVLRVHPRDDTTRPNPIGLHRVVVVAIDGLRYRVSGLEAVDGTPIVDVKPPLRGVSER
jgi:tRNA (Thr-GGU) A37 N-methylase